MGSDGRALARQPQGRHFLCVAAPPPPLFARRAALSRVTAPPCRPPAVADNNGVHLHLRNGLLAQFKANTCLAALCCILQTAIVGQMFIGQGALAEVFKLRTGVDQAEAPLLAPKFTGSV